MSGPTDPSEAHFDKGLWGFDGTVWRKLGIVWGYKDTVVEQVYDPDAVAGDSSIYTTVVPAGEVHKIENIVFADTNTVCTSVLVYAIIDSVSVVIINKVSPPAGVYQSYQLVVTLGPGDRLRCRFLGCALNDDLNLHVCGYKMGITL